MAAAAPCVGSPVQDPSTALSSEVSIETYPIHDPTNTSKRTALLSDAVSAAANNIVAKRCLKVFCKTDGCPYFYTRNVVGTVKDGEDPIYEDCTYTIAKSHAGKFHRLFSLSIKTYLDIQYTPSPIVTSSPPSLRDWLSCGVGESYDIGKYKVYSIENTTLEAIKDAPEGKVYFT